MRLYFALLATASVLQTSALSMFDNEFVDPLYVLSKNWSKTTIESQNTIVAWADELAAQGPWSVMDKNAIPPTGDKHTYMSWAPYWWPNCSGVGNTTELTPEQIWTTCPYYQRDGMFNPDRLLVNDTSAFNAMADAVLYNSLAWVMNGSDIYEKNTVNFIETWFINPATYMYPNLDYAQMNRGPNGQTGAHTGLLDFKCMAKVATAIEILRNGHSTLWTGDIDTQMKNWTSTYINWTNTAKISLEEKAATNNHGSFFFNQAASLQIIMQDNNAAQAVLKEYFDGIYQNQINSNGEQPFEAVRTHPYHYRCYNLAAMITNARLAEYVGYNVWNTTTKQGATIQDACDYAMDPATNPAGEEPPSELYEFVAAIGSVYGDPTGKYAAFMKNADSNYPAQPYFFWSQPFSDSGLVTESPGSNNNSGGKTNPDQSGGATNLGFSFLVVAGAALVAFI